MKININSVDLENFIVQEKIIGGDKCYLVTPNHIGCKWTLHNKIFRSSIWNENGEPVSLSLPKFVNFGENPGIFKHPKAGDKFKAYEKRDGSTLIVSRYKGETIFRTRGSFGVDGMECAHEINEFKEKYFDFLNILEEIDTNNRSFIFEWTSPNNKIVIPYSKLEFTLLTIISHEDYSFFASEYVDNCAALFGFSRPKMLNFNSIDELIDKTRNGTPQDFGFEESIFEGFCVYFDNDQEILKVKNIKYLTAHKFKENCNFETVLDIFIENKFENYNQLYEHIFNNFDYECAELARPEISKILDSKKEVDKILNHMKSLVESVKSLPSRKEQAIKIVQAYGQTNRSGFAFSILDGKEIGKDGIKKLYFQVINN